jgi:hypothetical protein
MTTTPNNFDVAFAEFLKTAQQTVADDYAEWTRDVLRNMGAGPKLEAMKGSRFIRLVSIDGTSRSAFGFVDKANGNVLKAASWAQPAKNFARGNIFDDKHGCGRIRWTGVA